LIASFKIEKKIGIEQILSFSYLTSQYLELVDMNGLIMAAQLILGLSILVTLHELGHFLAARAFGIKVEKFYLFFDA